MYECLDSFLPPFVKTFTRKSEQKALFCCCCRIVCECVLFYFS